MANIKKIIGVLLALVMALSVVTVAFAAENDAYSITVTSDKATLDAGESATVTVKVTANFNVCTMQIPVFFDNTKVDVSEETCLLSVDADRVKIVTENSPTAYQMFEGSGYTKDNYGVRALVYVAQQGDAIRTYNNEAVMTFKVTAKENATGNVVFECLEKTIKTSINTSGTLYLGTCAPNEDNELIGIAEPVDKANIVGATTTINFAGAAEGADLAVKAAYADSGIIIDKNKTFGGQYDGVVYGFELSGTINAAFYTARLEATNGGSIAMVKTPYQTRPNYGTGATVQVKNADGTLAKTYVIVIFGDITGDGKIQSDDITPVYRHANKAYMDDELKIMAANARVAVGRNDTAKATYLHTVDTTNITPIYKAANKVALNQAEIAASHALYNQFYQ